MIDLDVSELMLYFGDDYVINDKITLKQPKIKEIVLWGEAKYMSMVHSIVATPADLKSQLWDMGLDWNDLRPFDLFIMLSQTMTPDKTGIIFGDLDFSKMKPFNSKQNGDIVLADIESEIIIDELIYSRMMNYLRKLHHITPNFEKAKGKTVKKWMIEEDRQRILAAQNKPFESYLLPIISSVKARQGYTKEYVGNMGLYELMDEVSRLQIINNADHLLGGMYSGMIDTKKIDKKELNWLRPTND